MMNSNWNADSNARPGGIKRLPQRSAGMPFMIGSLLAAPLVALMLMLATVADAEPNPFEKRDIEEQALESFRRFLLLWQEELYFELYDLGIAATRQRITREEFARRMVELTWLPLGTLNPRYLNADMRFRTMVYIKARVVYRNKFNADQVFSNDQTMLLLKEDGEWRVDLIAMIRSPYVT
jgi:hypothetical protein